MILRLAIGSLLARALTVGMTILAIALSVALFLGVEKVRTGARASFADTISGTDLIIGARSGSVQLLLYSVFRIGNATNNVTWESYQDIANRKEVDWIVPISLGDSHKQFRVMGTTAEFFDRYKYRGGRSLEFREGQGLGDLYDTVIGADVAAMLGYDVGDPIVVAHGLASFTEHDDQPFRVAGILAKTGTPVDRTVIVSMEAIEAIHVDWQSGAKSSQATTPVEVIRQMDLEPTAITAALVGVKSRLQVFRLQRWINEYPQEPLLAILPGVALQELWPQRFGADSRPDVTISGMNSGANVGINVIYSGTVAAAVESAFLGVPAIAVSLHLGDRTSICYPRAAQIARTVIDRILEQPLEPHTVINVNIPRTESPDAPMPEIRVVEMNTAPWRDAYEERRSPDGRVYYWAAGSGMQFTHTAPGSDVDSLFERCVTITPLKLYWVRGRAKLMIGLAIGKRRGDKRQDLAKRADRRDMDRAMSR